MPSRLQGVLHAWFQEHARPLPWRGTTDPYAILVSELMLQQTQVARVVPFYQRFMERFPTVQALAAAPDSEVLSQWSGLGYYRRARLLQAAARAVVDRHGGVFPRDDRDLRALPGVGAYTQGALRALAFGEPAAAVDGNVVRVLSRLLALRGPVTGNARQGLMRHAALTLTQHPRPADMVQALMELGATVCTPRAPDCEACPWRQDCRARAHGVQQEIPEPRPRARRARLDLAVAVLVHRGRVRLQRRPASGLWAGTWALPAVDLPPSSTPPSEAMARHALLHGHPGLKLGPLLCVVPRTLTHRDLHLWGFAASGRPRADTAEELTWAALPPRGAPEGLSSAMRALLLAALRGGGGPA